MINIFEQTDAIAVKILKNNYDNCIEDRAEYG